MPSLPIQQLKMFCLAERLADAVWVIVVKWPVLARDTVGKQLIRSADSVGANIAEGHGRGSYQDNRRFVKIARGSLQETRFWLRRAYKRDLLDEDSAGKLQPLIKDLHLMLNGYLRSIGPAKQAAGLTKDQ